MAQFTTVDDLIAALNTETDAIAARIDKVIAAGGLTDAQKTSLSAISDRLTALGQDSSNPIPPTP